MYNNMYGEAEIAGTGWRDAHLFNWYFWYISAPEFLTDIFFIMENDFPLEQRRKYLKCFEWCTTFMRHWFGRETSLSRILVCTKVGIACENPDRLYCEYVDFDMLLDLEETAEGPHVDYVQWSHGAPYNNAYGKLNLDRVLYIASALAGTPLEFASPKQYNQFSMVKYMFEAAMYKGQPFIMFCGRDVYYSECKQGGAILADMLQMYGMFGEDEDNYLKKLIKRNASTPEIVAAIKANANFLGCTLADEIINDESINGENDYEYAHAWFTGDRAAQHRNDYAIGIAMSSKREMAYECITSANQTGWYTGDGSHYLYTNYDRNQYDGKNFIMNNIKVAYRFPGTTEDSRKRVARAIRPGREWKSSKSFAGSMQLEDKYIVATMDFESLNFDGVDDLPDDSGYGGGQPVHINDLVGKKSWFCFDNEIVCLGAGISSTMNSPVHTTVEHRRIVNDESFSQLISAEVVEELPKDNYEKVYTGCQWVLMEGHCGYYFAEPDTTAFVSRYVCKTAESQPFFELRIEHGENPTNASYAYALVPYATKESMAEYAVAPGFEIISNTAACQAVYAPAAKTRAYVFHEAGACEGVAVDSPAVVSVKEKGEELVVSMTDPTHELSQLCVTLNGAFKLLEKNPKMDIVSSDKATVITLNCNAANGRKFEARLAKHV